MAERRDGHHAHADGGRFAWKRFVPAAIVVAGLTLGYALGWQRYLTLDFLAESRDSLRALVAVHPVAAPAAYVALYTIAVAFAFPAASVLTIFGGFLFGWALSSVLVAVGATVGATLLFLTARSALGEGLRRRFAARAAWLADGFSQNAFLYLLALRLAPVFPFFALNIAPALFDVRLRTYVAATFIGILPGVVAYSVLGEGVDSVLDAAREAGRSPSIGDLVTPQITIAFAALALVAAIPAVVRTLRRKER